MHSTIKNRITRNLSNLPGWRTTRKIVVIESDDWGSIRMPSRKVFNTLSKAGLDLKSGDSLRYNLYDSLATTDDLTSLFEILSSVKDKDGKHCVLTAISLVANPDFEKIKDASFQQYFYKPFTQTLAEYPACQNSFLLWQEGIKKNLFIPQFHGREHLNVAAWMRSLNAGHKNTLVAFEHGMWGFISAPLDGIRVSFQAAFDIEDIKDLSFQEIAIKEGLTLFKSLFGYSALFFVPPNGPINRRLEKTASENGIRYVATSKIQREPIGNGKTRKIFHWLGQRNSYNQQYLTRNCFFEPSMPGRDWVSSCLSDINIAFRWYKPAVISSHRVNYIGAIDPKNRNNGLTNLKILLRQILQQWPDVEFMTSVQLAESMK